MKWAISAGELIQKLQSKPPHEIVQIPKEELQAQVEQRFVAHSENSKILVPINPDPDIDASFKVYNTPASLAKALESNDYKEWVSYRLPKKYDADAQHRYEIFCGGWLQFFDIYMMQNSTDHIISFNWSKEGWVSIKISVPPKDKAWSVYVRVEPPGFSDPPKPPPPPPPYG